MPSLEMRHQHHTGATVITLAGELDLTSCGRLSDYVAEVRRSPADHLVFDMGEVTFVDSHGLQALLDAYTYTHEHGGTVHLTALRGLPARLVEVTGVGDHVRLHSSTEIALASISVMPDLPPPTGRPQPGSVSPPIGASTSPV